MGGRVGGHRASSEEALVWLNVTADYAAFVGPFGDSAAFAIWQLHQN